MSKSLTDLLRETGEAFVFSAKEPIALTTPETVWWVESGTVDVFAVPGRDGEALGAREHLYRIAAEQVLLGIEIASINAGWVLVAVATPRTRVRVIPWVTLTGLRAEPSLREELVSLSGEWVSAVTRGTRRGIQPKEHTPLILGVTHDIAAGRPFFPVEHLVYMRLLDGEASLLSQDQLRVTKASGLLPLRDDAWMRAVSDCQVETLAPASALVEKDFWAGLLTYHSLIVRASLIDFERTAIHETARMQTKARQAAEQMQSGLAVFTNTLNREPGRDFDDLSQDPLVAACQLIGRRIDVAFEPPPRSGIEGADPVEEIANAARVRFRQVALRDDWWLHDGGHLLGRIQESKRPVALIRTRGGYELHDPVERTVCAVDEVKAEALVPFAQSFFRSLPARPLVVSDLIRFAFQGVRRDVAWVLGLGLLIGTLGMLTPMVTGYIFDTLIPASDRPQAVQVTGALVAVAVATAMFSVARAMATLRVESRMDAGLQAALWDRALNLPIAFFRRYASGDLAQRLNAISAIRQALSGTTLATLMTSAFALVNVLLLFHYEPRLALVAVGLVLGAMALTVGLGLFKLRYDRQMSEVSGRLSGLVLEYLRGVTKLRVTGSETRAFANWARQFGRLRRLAFGSGNVQNINDVFFSLYQVTVDIVIFGTVAWLLTTQAKDLALAAATAVNASKGDAAATGLLTTGQFIAFYGAFGQVMGAVTGLSATLLSILNLIPVYERVVPILAEDPEAQGDKTHPGELRGQIDLVNVTFRYRDDGPPVLDNVSFSIRPGGFVAIVGASGSGKSTLLRCLLGYEIPSAGGVFYDNQNIAGLDARAVRRQMGVVLQHSQVMTGDIFSNIVGSTLKNIDDAWEAARFCGLEEDIRAMPMGMHTVISEGGNTLSGGQRQRLLIARAIVQRPRILLFDEATSALDNRTQEMVTRSLDEMRATRVVIAHRLTTVMNANRILVLDQGRLVQSGTYKQLIDEPGIFQDLATRQLV
jgi:NHLM bacteriocin system ABC transporter ATP-binding protein